MEPSRKAMSGQSQSCMWRLGNGKAARCHPLNGND
jgi:hypothetical protein